MPQMSFDQFLQYLQQRGAGDLSPPAIEALRAREGIQVAGLPDLSPNGAANYPQQTTGELPPLPGQQPVYPQPAPAGALPGAPQPAPQPQMGGLPGAPAPTGGLDLRIDPMEQWRRAYTETEQLEREESAARKRQFEQGVQSLQAQRSGLSRQEKLFALSSALLSPTALPGFKGVMGNIAPTLMQMATVQRRAGQDREAELAKLQQQYSNDQFAGRRGGIKSRMDLLKMASDMSKPEKPRSGFNPITGELVNMDTGEQIKSAGPAVGTTKVWRGKQYRFMGGDQYDQQNWQEVR